MVRRGSWVQVPLRALLAPRSAVRSPAEVVGLRLHPALDEVLELAELVPEDLALQVRIRPRLHHLGAGTAAVMTLDEGVRQVQGVDRAVPEVGVAEEVVRAEIEDLLLAGREMPGSTPRGEVTCGGGQKPHGHLTGGAE